MLILEAVYESDVHRKGSPNLIGKVELLYSGCKVVPLRSLQTILPQYKCDKIRIVKQDDIDFWNLGSKLLRTMFGMEERRESRIVAWVNFIHNTDCSGRINGNFLFSLEKLWNGRGSENYMSVGKNSSRQKEMNIWTNLDIVEVQRMGTMYVCQRCALLFH